MNSFLTRTLSGIVFLGVLLAGILAHPLAYACLMLAILFLGMREFYSIVAPRQTTARRMLPLATGLALFLLTFLRSMGVIPVETCWLLAVPALGIFIQELYSKDTDPFQSIGWSILGIIYIALPFALLNSGLFDADGTFNHWLVLALFLFLWANDVGAYCFGMLFGRHGRHKLFERVSPKKSWEGFWGGLLSSMSAGFVLNSIWGERYGLALPHWLALALIVSLLGTYGDLMESLLKRSAGIKDSSNLIPGHGGVLDRFDGALLAFPSAIAYLQLMGLV